MGEEGKGKRNWSTSGAQGKGGPSRTHPRLAPALAGSRRLSGCGFALGGCGCGPTRTLAWLVRESCWWADAGGGADPVRFAQACAASSCPSWLNRVRRVRAFHHQVQHVRRPLVDGGKGGREGGRELLRVFQIQNCGGSVCRAGQLAGSGRSRGATVRAKCRTLARAAPRHRCSPTGGLGSGAIAWCGGAQVWLCFLL